MIPVCEIANSGMGRELKNPFPQFGNGKGMKKIHSHNLGTGGEWKKNILIIREWEGNEKNLSQNSGVGSECSFRQRMGAKSNFPIFWLLAYHENIK